LREIKINHNSEVKDVTSSKEVKITRLKQRYFRKIKDIRLKKDTLERLRIQG